MKHRRLTQQPLSLCRHRNDRRLNQRRLLSQWHQQGLRLHALHYHDQQGGHRCRQQRPRLHLLQQLHLQ